MRLRIFLNILLMLLEQMSTEELGEFRKSPLFAKLQQFFAPSSMALSLKDIPEEVKEHFLVTAGKEGEDDWLQGRVYKIPMILEANDPKPEEWYLYALLEYCNTLYYVQYSHTEGLIKFWHEI